MDKTDNENDSVPTWVKIGCGGCGGLIALTVLLLIIGVAATSCGPNKSDARLACQNIVKDRLKSPGSADFSYPEITSAGTDTWTVTGTVDSENSFGAMKRSTYTCKIRSKGDDQWTLLDLQHHER